MLWKMEKMLVAVFDDETKAYQGSSALKELDSEGSLTVHAETVVKKNSDGSLTAKELDDDFPVRTLTGTAIGALVGLLGGPIGLGIGTATGLLVGSVADLSRAGVNADYVDEVSGKLTPGKWAVVADVSEEWEAPADTKLEALGGTVFRATRESIEKEQDAKEEAGMKAQIAQLKEEQAHSRAEQKAKIQKKIDALNAKIDAKKQKARQRLDQEKIETEAKIHGLQEKVKEASGDTKRKLEARIDSLKKKHEETVQAQAS
jgi:uncharacterized membrane protein